MFIKINQHNTVKEAVITETSKLNVVIADKFKKELKPHLIEPDTKLIINLENISFIDSSGFGALISLLKVARSNKCQLKLCNINHELLEMFKLIHLHKVFDIEENLNTCLNNF
jgi:anti-sigma B factor antagonist